MIIIWKWYIFVDYRINMYQYRGKESNLVGADQGNKFLGKLCRETSCLIIKQNTNQYLETIFEVILLDIPEQTTVVIFVEDANLMIEDTDNIIKIQNILIMHDKLFEATNGMIKTKKLIYFSSRQNQKEEQKIIQNRSLYFKIKDKRLKNTNIKENIRFLQVHTGPSLKQDMWFMKMREKMIELVTKINKIEICVSMVYILFNIYLCKKVCFGYGIFDMNKKQEEELMRIYKKSYL